MQRDRREQGLAGFAGFAGLAAFYAGVQPAPGQSSDGRARRRGVCMHQNRSASPFAPPCKARHAATTHATGLRSGAPYKRLTAQLSLFLARIAACVCLHYWPCFGLESVQKTTQSPLSSAIPSTSHGPLLFHCPADHSSTSSAGPRLLACDRHSALQSLIDSPISTLHYLHHGRRPDLLFLAAAAIAHAKAIEKDGSNASYGHPTVLDQRQSCRHQAGADSRFTLQGIFDACSSCINTILPKAVIANEPAPVS